MSADHKYAPAPLPNVYTHLVEVHKHVDNYPSMTTDTQLKLHDQLHKEAGQ